MKYEFTNTGHGWIMPWVSGRDCSVDYGTIRWFNNEENRYEYASTALVPKNGIIEIPNIVFRNLYDYSIKNYLKSIGFNTEEDFYLIVPETKSHASEILQYCKDFGFEKYRVKKSIL